MSQSYSFTKSHLASWRIFFPDPSAFDQGLTGELEKGGEAVPGSDNHHRQHRHHRQPIPNGNRSGKSVPRLQQDQARLHQSGAALATRALAYGTLYAVAGCAALFFAIWKLSGAEDLKDFRQKAGSILPVIPKNNPPQGRTEFSGINDFLQYLSDEDEKNKKEKAARELQGEKEE